VQFVRLADARAQEDADLDEYAAADRDRRRKEVAADNAESARVSQGLTQLATVINAVRSKAAHVPWRSTKLTYALQGALGAPNKCVVVAHVTPGSDAAAATLMTLNFAATVHTGPKRRTPSSASSSGTRRVSTGTGGARPRAMSFDDAPGSTRRSNGSGGGTTKDGHKKRVSRAGSFHAEVLTPSPTPDESGSPMSSSKKAGGSWSRSTRSVDVPF